MPVVYQLVKFHGVVLFQIQLHKEILKLHDGMICIGGGFDVTSLPVVGTFDHSLSSGGRDF